MNKKAGLYFHIPFCKNKCPYCDFYSVKYDCKSAEIYTDLLIQEMQKYEGDFDTVYFGGGTPSIIEPELIGKILSSAREHFNIDENSEITIECNPSKDLADAFKQYKSYGINRVSIGMQSAVDSERLALGRTANKQQVEKTISDAKNVGIDNISLDVMIGTPKQTMDGLKQTFDFIDKMDVQHVSAYMLKIEEGTPFAKIEDKLNLPDEDEVSSMYLQCVDILKSIGFEQYEISNFAKAGFESKHNNKYWDLDDYLGIGKTAHSFWNGRRFYYDEDFNLCDDGIGGTNEERIMLGLRMKKGVKKSALTKPYGHFIMSGLMVDLGDRVALTPGGFLVSNAIIKDLI